MGRLCYAICPNPAGLSGLCVSDCNSSHVPMVAGQNQGGAKRLDDLPPAMYILTVLRSENGCERLVVVRYGIGGRSSQKARAG
jgi:hypothetical protein